MRDPYVVIKLRLFCACVIWPILHITAYRIGLRDWPGKSGNCKPHPPVGFKPAPLKRQKNVSPPSPHGGQPSCVARKMRLAMYTARLTKRLSGSKSPTILRPYITSQLMNERRNALLMGIVGVIHFVTCHANQTQPLPPRLIRGIHRREETPRAKAIGREIEIDRGRCRESLSGESRRGGRNRPRKDSCARQGTWSRRKIRPRGRNMSRAKSHPWGAGGGRRLGRPCIAEKLGG